MLSQAPALLLAPRRASTVRVECAVESGCLAKPARRVLGEAPEKARHRRRRRAARGDFAALVVTSLRQRRRALQATLRARGLAPDLRPRCRRLPLGVAVEDLFEQRGRQVLVGVLADLHHGRVGTHAQALDLLPGEIAVGRNVVRVVVDAALAHLHQRLAAAQHAGRGAAHPHVRFASDRGQLEHGVERGDLVDADVGHVQHVGDERRAGSGSQPLCCSCARHSSGMTAEACLPGG